MAEEKEGDNKANEPLSIYKKSTLTFTEVETQWDIQLNYALSLAPVERLAIMRQLMDRAFGIEDDRPITSFKGAKIVFGSYEYIP